MSQWQPTNPPTPPVQQQSWFARNKVLSIILGVVLVIVVCCCGGGVLAMSGDPDPDSTSSVTEESEDTAESADAGESATSEDATETEEPSDAPESSSGSSSTSPEAKETTDEPAEETTSAADDFTTEEENAIQAAEGYLEFMPFSKQGLIDQLSSSAGDGYPKEVATVAVEHIESDVDWNEQAVKAAENYLDLMSFSRSGLIQQLTSEAGDGYTQEQAEHAADEVGL